MSLSPKEKLEEDEQWIDDYEPVPKREEGELSEVEKENLAAYERHEEMKALLQNDFEEAVKQDSFKGLVGGLDIYITYRLRLFYEGLIQRGQVPPTRTDGGS